MCRSIFLLQNVNFNMHFSPTQDNAHLMEWHSSHISSIPFPFAVPEQSGNNSEWEGYHSLQMQLQNANPDEMRHHSLISLGFAFFLVCNNFWELKGSFKQVLAAKNKRLWPLFFSRCVWRMTKYDEVTLE